MAPKGFAGRWSAGSLPECPVSTACNSIPTAYTYQLKMVQRLSTGSDSLKLPEENIGEAFQAIALDEEFSDQVPKG